MRGRITVLLGLATGFLRWWGTELAALIPQRLRDRLKQRSRLPLVEVDDDGNLRAVTRPGRAAEDPAAQPLKPGTRCRLCVPASAVVGKRLVLPETAAATLGAVLRFQIEQETPFRAGEVYSDHVVVGRDAKAKHILVDWRLVPRAFVDRAISRAKALGLEVEAVGLSSARDGGGRFDFLRAERTTGAAGTGTASRRLRPALAGLLALFLIALVAVPLVRKLEAADALSGRLSDAGGAAEAARRLADELEQLRATAGFVLERREERPTVSELLRELTVLLPDDTWLHRLAVKGDEISIAGLSPSSTSLVAQLDAHPWFHEVTYRAPTLQRRDSGLEEFDLSLRLAPRAKAQ